MDEPDRTPSDLPRSEDQWRERLDPDAYRVLREEATEPPGSSPLNLEKRPGVYRCRACGQPLFRSDAKYESGSGWPSFFRPIEGAVDTKVDRQLAVPRIEYHCASCGSHQGHVFDDGPEPTGQRYCNNGIALQFEPREEA